MILEKKCPSVCLVAADDSLERKLRREGHQQMVSYLTAVVVVAAVAAAAVAAVLVAGASRFSSPLSFPIFPVNAAEIRSRSKSRRLSATWRDVRQT